MIIESITMTEFMEHLTRSRTVVIPMGSVEEHGPHLPLSTDTVHAYEICRKACEKTGAFLAPPVYYGVCRSTAQHPGTISISGETLRGLLKDLGRSFYQQGLRNLLFVSGHAGGTHSSSMVEAGEFLLETLPGCRVASLTVLDLGIKVWAPIIETPGDAHAGELETSVMMALRPDWVKGTAPGEFPVFPTGILVRDKRKFWPGGVWGDPSKASREKGLRCLEGAEDVLVQLIRKIEDWKE
jgi:creatinine amidohydrolase